MEVGTIVKLKFPCLRNPAGALGVVIYDYGDGSEVIFENGNYDGFSATRKMPNGQVERDFFLEKVGFDDAVAQYQFKNVVQLEIDFRNGAFNRVLKLA